MPTLATPGQRFTQLIQQLGLTKNAFAQSLGKTATVIQHIVDERNKPGYDLLNRICEVYPNVSSDWLVLGRGPMLRDQNPPPLFAEAAALVETDAPAEATVAGPPPVLDGIDQSDIPHAPRRRSGTLLQPADITATLVLAAQGHGKNGHAPSLASGPVEVPAASTSSAAATPAAPAPVPATPPAAPASVPAPAIASGAAPAPDPTYLAAALHTMQLQHQLALAEQRNQHLLEQQALLRQLVEVLQK